MSPHGRSEEQRPKSRQFKSHRFARQRNGPYRPYSSRRELSRRLTQLYVGLPLYALSMAMMVRADLGLDPWDVFHQGLTRHTPLTFGQATISASVVVMLLWIPLRQKPGLGTISNIIVIGLSVDVWLALIPESALLTVRIPLLLGAVPLCAFASGCYIGARFGPGPRDGLMTGWAAKTGRSIRLVRTVIEVSVLVVGILLGGTPGVGTVLFAFGIGPLTQFFLPRLTVRQPLHITPGEPGGRCESTTRPPREE